MASRSDEKIDAANPPEPGAVLIHVDAYERGGKPVSAYDYWRGANGENLGRVGTNEITASSSTGKAPTLSKKNAHPQVTEDIDTVIEAMDNAKSADSASSIAGQMFGQGNAHAARESYIASKRGAHAISGYFKRTSNNVNAKFRQVWEEEHEHDDDTDTDNAS